DPNDDSSAIHSGIVATSRATRPEGTCATASVTEALPMPGRRKPMSAALRHSVSVGRAAPVATPNASMSSPATARRIPHMRSGGMSAIAKRITRNVEPQMNQMHANASRTRRRSALSGTALLLLARRLGIERQRPVLLQRLERDRALGGPHGLDGAEPLAQH